MTHVLPEVGKDHVGIGDRASGNNVHILGSDRGRDAARGSCVDGVAGAVNASSQNPRPDLSKKTPRADAKEEM